MGQDRKAAKDKGGFRAALRKFASSDSELESAELRATVRQHGSMPITTCTDRQQVHLVGTVCTVTIHPRCGSPALEAELRDGSGTVTLVWLGRRRIPGIDPGRSISIEGRISCHEGRRMIYNPRYELLSAPAA